MNKAMLAIGAAAVLAGGSALAQPSTESAIGVTGAQPLQGQAAVDEAQREGASPGVMGPMPVPSGASTSSAPRASSAGQYSSDTAAQAPSAGSSKKSTARSKDKASSSSSTSGGAASGSASSSTSGGTQGSTGY